MASKQQKKREKKCDTPTIEEYYQNKRFTMPKEKTLETIFEEPKTSKAGLKQLTSVKKFKRFLEFDDQFSNKKLRKRRTRAKKFAKNFFDLADRSVMTFSEETERYIAEQASSEEFSLSRTDPYLESEFKPVKDVKPKAKVILRGKRGHRRKSVSRVKKYSLSDSEEKVLQNSIPVRNICNCDHDHQLLTSDKAEPDEIISMLDAQVFPASLFL